MPTYEKLAAFRYQGRRLGLRVINADGTSYGGFKNSIKKGDIIKAPDYISNTQCGNGLHC